MKSIVLHSKRGRGYRRDGLKRRDLLRGAAKMSRVREQVRYHQRIAATEWIERILHVIRAATYRYSRVQQATNACQAAANDARVATSL